jgi:hypothetical protein
MTRFRTGQEHAQPQAKAVAQQRRPGARAA